MNKPCKGCQYALEDRFCKPPRFYPYSPHCSQCKKYQKYLEFRESKRKYKKGKQITSMQEFTELITQDRFVYLGDKIYHEGVDWE